MKARSKRAITRKSVQSGSHYSDRSCLSFLHPRALLVQPARMADAKNEVIQFQKSTPKNKREPAVSAAQNAIGAHQPSHSLRRLRLAQPAVGQRHLCRLLLPPVRTSIYCYDFPHIVATDARVSSSRSRRPQPLSVAGTHRSFGVHISCVLALSHRDRTHAAHQLREVGDHGLVAA